MVKRIIFSLFVLLLGSILILRTQPFTLAAPDFHGSTPTPAAEEETTMSEPTVHDLLARVEALEAQIAVLAGQTPSAAQVNQVTTAVYLLDNAGLHDLDVRLNEEGLIQPYDRGRVVRIGRLLSTVDWPHELADDAETLISILTDLSAALGDDDIETAAPLALDAHELGHDLSHAAEHWLRGASTAYTAHDAPGQLFRVTAAVYLLDNAGFHDLDVRLNEEGLIQPYDSGRVTRIGRLLSTVDWPDEMGEDAATLIDLLTDLAAALGDDDLETAAPLALDAHELGHDLSHAAEHWLGGMQGDPHEYDDDDDHEQSEEPDESGG
ncbi:MAG: hypothetical protein KF893_00225 [Caldilineaceae bacterium]|nr:hypothetical protein [Caldilineaceae bacterium]